MGAKTLTPSIGLMLSIKRASVAHVEESRRLSLELNTKRARQETRKELSSLVQGVKEDLERMARMMDLQERGKVRIRGIFEDAANGAPSGGDAAPAAADAAAAPPVSSE